MGVDVELYFEKTGDIHFEPALPDGWDICDIRDYKQESHQGATHELDTLSRFYSVGYERGYWPTICEVLMLLFASPGVGKVWYGGGCSESIPEVTPEDVLALSRHFMVGPS